MKRLFIMRGLPGSGKSTMAKSLCTHGADAICSADDYFIADDGAYHFDPKCLPVAHAWCKEKAMRSMSIGLETVIIDNTNTQIWEFADYVDMAHEHGYAVATVNLFDGGCDDQTLADRNTHGVPLSAIKRMRQRFE